ncbi:MAG: hypothetical protein RKP20_15090, partial [Candidatus Competibacter sp.]|nr:hypothetical protein [Candidatus Competibacter sp.]
LSCHVDLLVRCVAFYLSPWSIFRGPLYAEAAAVKRLELLIAAQRRQVAHHAGDQWQPLLDYLSG